MILIKEFYNKDAAYVKYLLKLSNNIPIVSILFLEKYSHFLTNLTSKETDLTSKETLRPYRFLYL